MNRIIYLIILILAIFSNLYGQATSLYIIKENGKEGFIDEKGSIVIPPKFIKCNDFSEGLAAVRLNGRYGFINNNGDFVIEPIYDFATKFINGIASVYLNGKVLFIDKSNNIIIDTLYNSIQIINKNKVIVQNASKNKGLLDLTTNKLLLDTIFKFIKPYQDGILVLKYKEKIGNITKFQNALVDSLGNFIVDFGKYIVINNFIDGVAKVAIQSDSSLDEYFDGAIDTKGNLLYKKKRIDGKIISKEDFYNGYAVVVLEKYRESKNNNILLKYEDVYSGYTNLKGEIVLNDTLNQHLYNFANYRTFIKNKDNKFILVDTKFQQIGNEIFHQIQNYGFKNGYAIVKRDKYWGIIDTNGNYVVKPKYEFINGNGVRDNYYFYGVNKNKNENKYIYGIANLNGEVILEPIIDEFDHSGFINGLLKTHINKLLTYIDKKGNIIWQEKEEKSNVLRNLNTDNMETGKFYSFSKSKKITNMTFKTSTLSVYVEQNNQYSYHNIYNGYKVYVYNNDKNNIEFRTKDDRLYMKVQALNDNGIWNDIEYLPNSFCGNSYHILTLKKNNFWEFIAPKYEGEIKTKLRIELKYLDPNSKSKNNYDKKEITIYSNEFEGSINPAQYWNKEYELKNGIVEQFYE